MTIGFIIGLVITGLVVGALGRLLHPGRDPMGILMTLGIGIASMLIVGIILRGALGALGSFLVAVLVAALIVTIWARLERRGPDRYTRV
jgi:uncharacterized membrane protein YeaQ/YmgE (transglycosylase-associated protein family)